MIPCTKFYKMLCDHQIMHSYSLLKSRGFTNIKDFVEEISKKLSIEEF